MDVRQRYSSVVKSRGKGLENVQLTPAYPEVTPDSKAFSYVWAGVDVRLGAQPVPITRHCCWAVSERLHCNSDPYRHTIVLVSAKPVQWSAMG